MLVLVLAPFLVLVCHLGGSSPCPQVRPPPALHPPIRHPQNLVPSQPAEENPLPVSEVPRQEWGDVVDELCQVRLL